MLGGPFRGDKVNRFGIRSLFATLALFFPCFAAYAGVIHVSPDGNDANDGLTWATAKKTIGAAIAAAPSNPTSATRIFIKEGVYSEWLTINSKNKLELYGGFSGNEDTSTFDPETNDNRSGGETAVDGASQGRCFSIKKASTVTLDRLSLVNGLASGFGGGLSISDSTAVTVRDVTISDCTTRYQLRGGGLYGSFSGIHLYGVTIRRCVSASDGGGGWLNGCGIWAQGLRVERCSATVGGGLNLIGCYGVIARSAFNHNTATSSTGGGGAVRLEGSGQLTIQSSSFIGNRAALGAALYFCNRSNGYLLSSVIARNESTQQGAVAIRDAQTYPSIFNCTLARNVALAGSPAISMGEGTLLKLTNSVLVSNSGPGAAVGRPLDSYFWSDSCTYYDNENGDLTFSFDGAPSDTLQDPKLMNSLPAFWEHPLAYAHVPDSHLTDYALPRTTESLLGSRPLGQRRDQGAFEAPEPSMAETQYVRLAGWRGPDLDGNQSWLPMWVRVEKQDRILSESWVPQSADGYYLVPLPYFAEERDTFLVTVKCPGYLSAVLGGGEINVLVGCTGIEVELMPGDVDGNDVVDVTDVNAVMLAFTRAADIQSRGSLSWGLEVPDLDGNGEVEARDLTHVMVHFGKRGALAKH